MFYFGVVIWVAIKAFIDRLTLTVTNYPLYYTTNYSADMSYPIDLSNVRLFGEYRNQTVRLSERAVARQVYSLHIGGPVNVTFDNARHQARDLLSGIDAMRTSKSGINFALYSRATPGQGHPPRAA